MIKNLGIAPILVNLPKRRDWCETKINQNKTLKEKLFRKKGVKIIKSQNCHFKSVACTFIQTEYTCRDFS